MKIEYQHIFGLPRKIVWKCIKDEKVLGNTIPNCKSIVQVSNGLYQAQVDIQMGPIKDVFALEVKLEKEKSPAYYHVHLKGKGSLGEFSGKADLFLSDLSRQYQAQHPFRFRSNWCTGGCCTARHKRRIK